jgi:alkylhydroperoxidase family enzyme
MARIEPLAPPYEADVQEQLTRMMPPGVDPIGLFRTFARNTAMTTAMNGWGAYELGRTMSLSRRQREIVIDRVTARCGCEYEWGVHIAFFAEAVGLSDGQVRSLTSGTAADDCWDDPTERLLIETVDSLHDTSDIDDDLYGRLGAAFSDAQLLDLFLLTGWYHAISFCARAARVDLEPGAPTFATFAGRAP